jgi:hypothetical protein
VSEHAIHPLGWTCSSYAVADVITVSASGVERSAVPREQRAIVPQTDELIVATTTRPAIAPAGAFISNVDFIHDEFIHAFMQSLQRNRYDGNYSTYRNSRFCLSVRSRNALSSDLVRQPLRHPSPVGNALTRSTLRSTSPPSPSSTSTRTSSYPSRTPAACSASLRAFSRASSARMLSRSTGPMT